MNDFLNNPPPPGSSRSGGGAAGGGGGMMGGLPGNLDFNNLGDNELQSLLNNMDQRQLMQVIRVLSIIPLKIFDPPLARYSAAAWAAVTTCPA